MHTYKTLNYRTVKELLEKTAELYANNTAFILKKNKQHVNVTYAEMYGDIVKTGAALIELGLKGKHIAVIGPNSYPWFISCMAASCGCGVGVPLDKGLTAEEIKNSIVLGDVDALIYDNRVKATVEEAVSMIEGAVPKLMSMDELREASGNISETSVLEWKNAEIKEDDIYTLVFTSGTTSNAKAVVLSHYNVASNINSIFACENFYPTDVNMAFLPYHHTFGLTGQLVFITAGAATAYCDGIKYVQKNLAEYGVSTFFCVPLIVEFMHKKVWETIRKQGLESKVRFGLKLSGFLMSFGIDIRKKLFAPIHEALGGHLRLLIAGAAAFDKEVERDFNAFGIMTIQGYGLTETSPVVCAENDDNVKYGSIGKPLPGIEVKLDDIDSDGVGELVVKGPNVMQGYYKNQEATDAVIIDGWFHTGDFCTIDKDGFITIAGRKKNVIVLKNGKNVFPEELETLLAKWEFNKESMIWGYGPIADQKIALKLVYDKEKMLEIFKELNENSTEKDFRSCIWGEIKKFNETMVNYKHIEYLTISEEEMIKTSTMKIKRPIAIAEIKEDSVYHISESSK